MAQKWFRHELGLTSQVKYIFWRAADLVGLPAGDVAVKLKNGPSLLVRPPPARDLDTAYELFCQDVYRFAVDRVGKDVRCVVDLGGNTGYSLAYLAWSFPESHLFVFEPNPVLLGALHRNIRLNGLEPRVTVHAAAACSAPGEIQLTDEESESTVLARPGVRTFTVRGEDLFEALAGVRVDLLKMDIEGAEYALLSDPRFFALKPRAIVMEWHSTETHPDGERWCVERLTDLGYSVHAYMPLTHRSGMIFAET
jgi:FkbM family methyltransferase